jgi:hypothetical protein
MSTATPPIKAVDAPEASTSGAVRTKDAAFAEIVRLTAAIVRHTRASQELAADSLVEKALADAAAVRRSFVVTEAIELAGHSTATHTLKVDRGVVEVVEIPKP